MPRYVFQIIDKCFQDASHIDVDSDVDFLLEESDWNDYGYMTLYGVHATAKRSRNEKTTYLGSIRIMRIDQQVNESLLLRKDFGKYHFKFRSLPDTYVSLSMDVDFYENLQQILRRPGERFDFANSLNMILGTDSEDYAKVYSLLCFQKSLLRDSNIDDFAIQQGRKIMLNEEILFDLRTEAFKIKFPSTDEYIEFDFQAVSDVLDSDTIPNGIVALIGKNGSGKSTTLYEIAKILYASPDTRRLIEDKVGRLETNAIGISKLIMFSYSAFDNFILPGSTKYECTMLIDGLQNHTGRFVFCGIRDVYYDMNELYETNRNKEDDEFIKITSCARTTGIRLKEPAKLGEEFVYAMSNFGESDRLLWIEFIKSVRNSQPELWQAIKNISEPLVSPFMNLESIYLSHFNRLSTGYKFVMHAMSHLISNCENNNLILFDEPENHLQPPLLSFVIKEMRKVLAKYKSVMLIATHSPIILQEIFAKNVKIVRGVGEKRIFSQPKIETYGESFGAIASEVFNLNSDNTGYYSTIEMLYDMWNMDKSKSLKEMISSFEHKMDSHLSAQMEAFLISKYVKNHAR